MLARRAKKCWIFLSLDYTGPFFNDLWVPISDVTAFKTAVQNELRGWVIEDAYHRREEELSYALASWYQATYGQKALNDLLVWMRRIYLEPPDRLAETVWNVIPLKAHTVAREFPNFDWVFTILDEIRRHQELKIASFDQRLANQESLSAWDADALAVQYADRESLDTKIDLIVTYNVFLDAWEKFCGKLDQTELQALFEVGRKVIQQNPMSDLEPVFPGSWRFEIHELLLLFT